MALPSRNPERGEIRGIVSRVIVGKGMILHHALVFGLLFPVMVLWGGSTHLINWGPGLLVAGAACLLLLDKDRLGLRGGGVHTGCFLGFLALLFFRARYSADVSAAANSSALMGLAAVGFLIGRLGSDLKSRALFIGLSLVTMVNLACSVIQMGHPEWNPVYPPQVGGFPCGLFAHYSYSAAFCLGSAGLLATGGLKERGWLKAVMIGGAICALVSIPISMSRGGNLALAFMIAGAISLLLARAFSKSRPILSMWLPGGALLALPLILGASVVPLIGRNKGPDGFYGDSVRIDFWHAATRIAENHPWLGGGPGCFAWESFHVMDGLTHEPGMVHNEALQLAVEYGYPALALLAALIAAPVAVCFWRFVNRTAPANTAWAALGLVAMFIQSNFESIFHASPGVFVAALALGKISRDLWKTNKADAVPDDLPDLAFAAAIKSHVGDYLAGDEEAVSRVMVLLPRLNEPQLRKTAYDLMFWQKTRNEDALRQAMIRLGAMFAAKLETVPTSKCQRAEKRVPTPGSIGWPMFGNLALAACALPVVIAGASLSNTLHDAWAPLYDRQRLTCHQGFERLFQVTEKNPGLGIDRQVLSAARDCIHQFENLEDREEWAAAHRTRIERALPGWKTDPGAALLIAEIAGWAGDCQSALEFYDHAIEFQGSNELLFMAHSFKGQYLYELSISSGAARDTQQQRFFARQAIGCFEDASEALGTHRRKLDPYFGKMRNDCERFGKKDM